MQIKLSNNFRLHAFKLFFVNFHQKFIEHLKTSSFMAHIKKFHSFFFHKLRHGGHIGLQLYEYLINLVARKKKFYAVDERSLQLNNL